jgi:hypothetical protein
MLNLAQAVHGLVVAGSCLFVRPFAVDALRTWVQGQAVVARPYGIWF